MRSRRITGVRNFRQALASPHSGSPGRGVHDSDATTFLRRAASASEDGAMTRTRRLLSIAVLSTIVTAGCASGVRIAELKTQPDKYKNKTVSVTGVVTKSVGVSLVPFQMYNVDDGTGEITVV